MLEDNLQLTERQRRELEYHREHAKEHEKLLQEPFSWDVLQEPSRRWWNAYWQMYAFLTTLDLEGKRVLVVGCGFGDDALRLAKLGAEVHAFDLSPESISIARQLAARESLNIRFEQMAAETLRYEDAFFDLVLARDILHHVDIPATMREISRVAKQDALLVLDEVYSHSFTDTVRRSRFVDGWLYPRMQSFVYGTDKPYITEDERKLTEKDLALVEAVIASRVLEKHFNFVAGRMLPAKFDLIARADRLLLTCLKPFGRYLAGRLLYAGRLQRAANGSNT